MVLNYSRSLAEDFAGEQQGGAGWWAAGVPQMDREYQTAFLFFIENWTMPEDMLGCHKLGICSWHLLCRG